MLRHPERHRRGASLITALMLGALALTLALTLAGMSFSHLTVSSRLSNISQSRNLAEAVVAQAIEKVVSSKGEAFMPGSATMDLSIAFAGAPGGLGRLTFDPAVAEAEKLPLSTNNMRNDESVDGFAGRVVPPNAIHLVGVGSHRGVTRTIECLIHFPVYRFALSSKGEIYSTGSLIVAGADEPADIAPSVEQALDDGDQDDLLPGHVASNNAGLDALVLNPTSGRIAVTGDLRSHGQINAREKGATVDGDEVEGAQQVDLPEIDLADFDPNNFGGGQALPGWDPSSSPPPVLSLDGVTNLDGMFRHNGNVVLDKLRMPTDNTGSILWVNGDLTIRDGIHGVGAIFATGDVTIEDIDSGPSTLSTDNALAVVAGKKLTIRGAGDQDSSYFQGVVAAGADMEFSNVTVAGAAVNGSTRLGALDLSSDNPKLSLTEANFVHMPSKIDFEFKFDLSGGAGGWGGKVVGFDIVGGVDPSNPEGPPLNPVGLPSVNIACWPEVELEHFYDPETDSFVENNWSSWDGFGEYSYDPATRERSGSPFAFFVDGTAVPQRSDMTENGGQLDALLANGNRIRKLTPTGDPVIDPSTGQPVYYASWAEYTAATGHSKEWVVDEMIKFFVHGSDDPTDPNPEDPRGQRGYLAALNRWYDNHGSQPQQNGTFSMNPNQFVQWDSRTKIVLWREL